MAAALNCCLLKHSLLRGLLSLLIAILCTQGSGVSRHFQLAPPACTQLECLKYDVIHSGNGLEIRRFQYSVCMSTSPIEDILFSLATQSKLQEAVQLHSKQQRREAEDRDDCTSAYQSHLKRWTLLQIHIHGQLLRAEGEPGQATYGQRPLHSEMIP
ncbi:hypothetical protein Ancab_025700 [Ancistrocladus abbreviatus]